MTGQDQHVAMTRGLPANLDAEKFILGCVLLDGDRFPEIGGEMSLDDFILETHRRIFSTMREMYSAGIQIDRITIAEELQKRGELESVGGLTYLVSLDDGLPQISNLDGYMRIVREKSTLRKLAMLHQNMLDRCIVGEEPPQGLIESARTALMKVYDSADTKETAETAYEIVGESGGVDAFFSAVHGIPSPWPKLDFFTGGWQKGELILIGARPSMGKTAFLINLLWGSSSENSKHSIFYTCEMKKQAIVRRFISLITGISYQAIQQANLTHDERNRCRKALDQIQNAPLRVVESSGKSIIALRAHAEKKKHRGELDVIGVDYIGLLRSGSKSSSAANRNQELGDIARELKRMAMDLDVPVICLSQLNRAVENRTDKRPGQADLRDSGEIEEHADLIGFLHRPGYYNRDDAAIQNVAELIISKQRNGDTPIIGLEFARKSGLFTEERDGY